MTIDEAINHAMDVANEQIKLYKRYDNASGYSRCHVESLRTSEAKRCEKCADEHLQLYNMLMELKKYRHLKDQVFLAKTTIKKQNSDFLTGYVCALSVVEGMIAEVENNENN